MKCVGWILAVCAAFAAQTAYTRCAVSVDFSAERGRIKPLHGVNNAPVRPNGRQDELGAAGIPYVRTHDTYGQWGGTHYVDIPNVFPDFDADENDQASYDFAFTDAYLKPLVEAGCGIFYRLGVTIENNWKIKAYNIYPPKDFAKWARVCEHVVRHYNEGWANGFRWDIKYWEIWNEPENPAMWQGTKEQFFDLYRIAANHLKRSFPGIKVGGYSACGFYAADDARLRERDAYYRSFVTWFEDFCRYVQSPETKAPLDFFAWHIYVTQVTSVDRIATHAEYVRRTLDAAGLTGAESILSEWNVFREKDLVPWNVLKSHVSGANVAAAFCRMQTAPVDMATYYDALPTRSYCGLFYFPEVRTTPCYEAFRAWNELAKLGTSVAVEVSAKGVYAAAARGFAGRAVLVCNAGEDPDAPVPSVAVDIHGVDETFRIYRMDGRHDKLTDCGVWRGGAVEIPPCGIVLALSGTALGEVRAAVEKARSLNGL